MSKTYGNHGTNRDFTSVWLTAFVAEWGKSGGQVERGEGQMGVPADVTRQQKTMWQVHSWSCTKHWSANRGPSRMLKCDCVTRLVVKKACCFAILLEAKHT